MDGLVEVDSAAQGCPVTVTASSLHLVILLYRMDDVGSTRCGGGAGESESSVCMRQGTIRDSPPARSHGSSPEQQHGVIRHTEAPHRRQ